jgi:hypothetical protein
MQRRLKEKQSENFSILEGTKNAVFLYTNIVNSLFMATSVYSIRIDSRVRKMIDELPGRECQEEIRALIENTVRMRRREQLLNRALKRQETKLPGMSAARIIREARDDQ